VETIKGGFPLPINWHVSNCSSSGKLHKPKRACLPLRRSMAARSSTASQTSWTSKPLKSAAFPHVVPCHRALNSQPHNSGVVSRPPHRPTSSLYSLAVRIAGPEYPLLTNVGSWPLCTPILKLKIFFPETRFQKLNETVFWMWVDFFFFFFLPPLFPWFSFFPVLDTSWLVLLLFSGLIPLSTLLLCEEWTENYGGIVFFQTLLLLESVAVMSCRRRQAVGTLPRALAGNSQCKDEEG